MKNLMELLTGKPVKVLGARLVRGSCGFESSQRLRDSMARDPSLKSRAEYMRERRRQKKARRAKATRTRVRTGGRS